MDMSKVQSFVDMFYGIVKAFINFMSAVGKFDPEKINGIFGKISKGAEDLKDMKDEIDNV